MTSITKNPTQLFLATLVLLTLITPWAPTHAADKAGTVKSSIVLGKKNIYISDPDGIKWYTVYDRDGTDWTPLKGHDHEPGNCKTSVPVSLDQMTHNHLHKVQYEDCKKNKEAWIANKLTGVPTAGTRTSWHDDSDDDDDTSLRIDDINLDTIPDVVVATNNSGTLTVSVMVGNGDGSFQEPQTYSSTTPSDSLLPMAEYEIDEPVSTIESRDLTLQQPVLQPLMR